MEKNAPLWREAMGGLQSLKLGIHRCWMSCIEHETLGEKAFPEGMRARVHGHRSRSCLWYIAQDLQEVLSSFSCHLS